MLIFSRAALGEIDRRCVAEYGIPILVLMENAGRAVAEAALKHFKGKALVLCGPGNNGGDGLVAARHLHNAGIGVEILLLAEAAAFKDAAAVNLQIAQKMKLAITTLSADHAEVRDWLVESSPNDSVIDALFGTGLSRAVTGLAAEVIGAINRSGRRIVSVDIPSGLDADTGEPLGVAIKATETVSFCGSKAGFTKAGAKRYVGKLAVAEIGAPVESPRVSAESVIKETSPSLRDAANGFGYSP